MEKEEDQGEMTPEEEMEFKINSLWLQKKLDDLTDEEKEKVHQVWKEVELRKQLEEAVDLLKKMEWVAAGHEFYSCPFCGGIKPGYPDGLLIRYSINPKMIGHRDCRLRKLLDEVEND